MMTANKLTVQSALPKMPERWQWVRLGDVCEIVTGNTPPRDHPSFYGGIVPWIKPDDLDKTQYVDTSAECLTEEGTKVARILPSGSVLVSCIGKLGKVAIAACPLATNQQINALIPSAEIDSVYLYYVCKFLRPKLEAVASLSLIAIVNKSTLSQIMIPLPPLSEQKNIAAILYEQAEAGQKARAAVEAQLEAVKTLPSAYLRTTFESSEAQEWPRKRFGDLAEITAPQVDPRIPQYGALPHISAENIERGVCRLKFLNTAAEDGMISGKYLFKAGDVLYSKIRPYLRKALVAEFQGLCSADMYPIKVRPELLDPHFTAWMLISDEFTEYADRESRRARMPKLNREQVFAWEAPVPPLLEQRQIVIALAEQMKLVERAQKAIEEELVALETLLKALLEQAFSGKL